MREDSTFEVDPLLAELTLNPDNFPGRMDRFLYFVQHVRPWVNTDRILIYTASGFDLAAMVGSGVREAMYVDPCYKSIVRDQFSSQNGEALGFDVLINRVRKIDNHPKVIRNVTRAAVMGTIRFVAAGEERVLHVVGMDAVDFNRGFSGRAGLYVSLGHGVPKLFGKPVKADIYVVSTFLPRAWGYGDIQVEAGEYAINGFAVAKSFKPQDLDQSQMSVLSDTGSNRVFEEIAIRAKEGSVDDVRRILALGFDGRTIEGKSLGELSYLRFQRFWRGIQTLSPSIKERLSTDLIIYLNNIFAGVRPELAELLKRGIKSSLVIS